MATGPGIPESQTAMVLARGGTVDETQPEAGWTWRSSAILGQTFRPVNEDRSIRGPSPSPTALYFPGFAEPALPTLVEKAGIGTEGHDRVRFVMLQQGPTPLLLEADEADIACLSKSFTHLVACGKNGFYPRAFHDKIELAELAPDLIRQRPASCIVRHGYLPAQDWTIAL